MAQPLSWNDAVLVASLLYSCVDLRDEWDSFDSCARPIHHWLLASYACVIVFRAVHLLGAVLKAALGAGGLEAAGGSSGFLVELRHKNAVLLALTLFTWLVALPVFVVCTAVGTAWLWQVRRDTPECMPSKTHALFSGFWLALCYLWMSIHLALGVVAAVLERRARRAEGDLREIADTDVISRWGPVSELAGYSTLGIGMGASRGLTPAEIRALPEAEFGADAEPGLVGDASECSICIMPFEVGDKMRLLPTCGHAFHKPCVDLWLLRNAECPLCKRSLRGVGCGCNC